MPQEHELKISRRFKAPREKVFNAFLEPAALQAWWGPEGMTCPEPRVDARLGGAYELSILNDAGEPHTVAGVYQEITAPERLVFTWRWAHLPEAAEMLVTLTFNDVAGDTVLDLHQTLMPSDGSSRMHNQGWSSSFNKLDVFLSR
ncbi:MAG: SRPBCC domain-containing protein [Rhodospirillaceae bacterium]|jgi:uncharacterized protein YndB with AHSA1/START domain|nr:SRPBCC domain-containing protein [Rhodospirillaceae bacterium]MBT7615109.1 SRPBCC domain-containing protein [Rhodospirillaceae bacterium]